jgi:hypothetical protein
VSEIKINKEPASAEQLAYFGNKDTIDSNEASSWMMDIVSVGDGQGKSILKTLSTESGLTVPPAQSLSTQDLRILKLLSLLSQNTKVVVLEDPFEDIPDEMVEPLAKAMVEIVERSKAIVIIKKLSQRPEAWIENEHVERVQIEAPRQRTIGFGGHRVELGVDFLGNSSPKNPQLGLSSAMHPALDPSTLPGFRAQRNMLRVALLTSLVAAILVVSFFRRNTSTAITTADNQPYTLAAGEVGSRNYKANSSLGTSKDSSDERTEAVQLALASYPQDIQIAVTRAFNSPEEEIKQLPSFPPTPARVVTKSAPDHSPPAYSSGSYDSEQPPVQTESDEELAERRARVRQSFLEALARARERLAAERAGQE